MRSGCKLVLRKVKHLRCRQSLSKSPRPSPVKTGCRSSYSSSSSSAREQTNDSALEHQTERISITAVSDSHLKLGFLAWHVIVSTEHLQDLPHTGLDVRLLHGLLDPLEKKDRCVSDQTNPSDLHRRSALLT